MTCPKWIIFGAGQPSFVMKITNKTILVISSATDATATYLCEQFAQKNIQFVRFDTETFPENWKIHWDIPNSSAVFIRNSQEIRTDHFYSVWYRRPSPPGISFKITEPSVRNFARRECEKALTAIWQDIDIFWVNHPSKIQYASHKPHQLKVASRLGFNIPETILSSDQEQVRTFWNKHQGQVVFKSLHQDAIEVDNRNYFAYTSRLTVDRLSDLTSLRLAPVLFQQYIRPKSEVRVTVIGEKAYAASIIISEDDEPDWRRISPDNQGWMPCVLPMRIEELCIQLIKAYDLNFGAIDLIQTNQGEYYFLDLNPNGQWVWIELITGMNMSNDMIGLLSGKK